MGGQDFTISYRGTVKGDVIVMTRDTHSDTVTVGANGKLTKSHDAPMKFVAKRSRESLHKSASRVILE